MFQDPLDTVFLVENTKTRRLGARWVFEKETPSTNDLARQLANEQAPEGTVVIAEAQSKGKGRQGRSWNSPAQGGLYLSILLYPPTTQETVPFLTLLAGVAAVNALKDCCEASLKWPNDLLVQHKKLCGILCEYLPDTTPGPAAVIGVGINVHQNISDFPQELQETATSLLMEAGRHIPRTTIAHRLVIALDQEYGELLNSGSPQLIRKWSERSQMFGKEVTLTQGPRTVQGVVKRLDSQGRLVLETSQGEEAFSAGETSLKK